MLIAVVVKMDDEGQILDNRHGTHLTSIRPFKYVAHIGAASDWQSFLLKF